LLFSSLLRIISTYSSLISSAIDKPSFFTKCTTTFLTCLCFMALSLQIWLLLLDILIRAFPLLPSLIRAAYPFKYLILGFKNKETTKNSNHNLGWRKSLSFLFTQLLISMVSKENTQYRCHNLYPSME